MEKPIEVVQKSRFSTEWIIFLTILGSVSFCVSSWVLDNYRYKYVDMCDPFNQGQLAMGCHYGAEVDCQTLGSLRNECREDGKSVKSGWRKINKRW